MSDRKMNHDRFGLLRQATHCAGALLCAVLLGAFLPAGPLALGNAGAGSADGSPGGDSDGGIQLLSEAIGSLPGFWVDDAVAFVDLPAGFDESLQADLHLHTLVPDDAVHELFSGASGDGYALLSLPPEQPGWTRVRVFGDVDITLDRGALAATQSAVGLEYGVENLGAIATITWKALPIAQYAVADGLADTLIIPTAHVGFLQAVAESPAILSLFSLTSGSSSAILGGSASSVEVSLQ